LSATTADSVRKAPTSPQVPTVTKFFVCEKFPSMRLSAQVCLRRSQQHALSRNPARTVQAVDHALALGPLDDDEDDQQHLWTGTL